MTLRRQGSAGVGRLGAARSGDGSAASAPHILPISGGVPFNLLNITGGERYIDIGDWSDLDRAMIGSFLGYMSMQSYEQAGFFSSALAVTKLDGSPSEGFYSLLKEIGLITNSKSDKAMYIWADHVAKAHTWYATH